MPIILSNKWYYANSAEEFINDAERSDYIVDILEQRYKEDRGEDPSISLLLSWHKSPKALASALKKGNVNSDQIVVLEYSIDSRNRIDALICGFERDIPNGVIVETKQWTEDYQIRACDDPEKIEMQFRNGWKAIEHPSVQAMRYRERIQDVLYQHHPHQVPIQFTAYAYLHNCLLLSAQQLSVLRGDKFGAIFDDIPIYTSQYAKALGNRIRKKTKQGNGIEILRNLDNF